VVFVGGKGGTSTNTTLDKSPSSAHIAIADTNLHGKHDPYFHGKNTEGCQILHDCDIFVTPKTTSQSCAICGWGRWFSGMRFICKNVTE